MKSRGFTLIELLIVVAIIGILAAIAVPNFLNAQVRAQLARVQSDQKSFGDAMEMYFLDNNSYPWTDDNPHGSWPLEQRWAALTTPIAYMSTVPFDPFGDHVEHKLSTGCPNYVTYDSWVAKPEYGHFSFIRRVARELGVSDATMRYAFVSQGPDRLVWACEGQSRPLVYEPSNGLNSWGDVVRAGPGGLSRGG